MKRLPARLLTLGWGVLTLGLIGWHVKDESVNEIVVGYSIPLLVTIGLVGLGAWLERRQFSVTEYWRVGLWGSAGVFGLFAFEVSAVWYESFEGNGMAEPMFALLHAATAGAFIGALLGIYDVRSRRRATELKKEQQWADRLRQVLLVLQRVLRHDIRTSVNIIQGNAERLRSEMPQGDDRTETIMERAGELEAIATKVQEIESIAERGAQPVQQIEMRTAVESVAENIASDYRYAAIDVAGPESVAVHALPEIRTAIEELIENSIVHTDAETPSVTVEIRHGDDDLPDDTVAIDITDNGPGIPRNEIEVIESGEVTQLQHSSGVGLWMAKWITGQSHGSMKIHTNESSGTTISVTLPTAVE